MPTKLNRPDRSLTITKDHSSTGNQFFEKLMTKQQVSERTSFSVSYIDKLMTKGLPYLKIGRTVRFKWNNVAAWLLARSTS